MLPSEPTTNVCSLICEAWIVVISPKITPIENSKTYGCDLVYSKSLPPPTRLILKIPRNGVDNFGHYAILL
jgi:hypothetical protein